MNVSGLLILILAGFWAPTICLYTLWLSNRRVERRSEARSKFDQDTYRRESEYRTHRTEMALDQILSQMERQEQLYTSLATDFSREVSDFISKETREAVRDSLGPITRGWGAGQRGSLSENHSLLGELAHSLKTPLAHIEVTARGWVKSSSTASEVEEIHDVLSSVELCKASLAAFRELGSVASVADSWSPSSLRESTQGAISVYSARTGKHLTVENDLPESIPEYSNSYLLAVALPLLENAIEASPNGEPLRLSFDREAGNRVAISIENTVDVPVDKEKLYTAGMTSKPGHDGLGVATVEDLIKAYENAELSDHSYDGRFVMTVYLPGK
ncbi:GHKL domain-containing protein [Streptomyces sp. N2A]|uniref:sensor histidine kinase n=1 Tax=Streptomyces sp. N2A TaxID=3073936 RepID=UPI002870B241|nr:GHKL domain-containing protein [Streptomyces sp. N2A]